MVAGGPVATVTAGWHQQPICGFDIESTGVDPLNDRIVTASVTPWDPQIRQVLANRQYLIDPGVDIPEQATAVHGVTTEQAREHGQTPATAIRSIILDLLGFVLAGTPLAVFNASFDLSMLRAEALRHGLIPLHEQAEAAGASVYVVDGLVIDKAADKYRKGRRTLQVTCQHYGVVLDDAHTSAADSLAAAQLAVRLGEQYPQIVRGPLDDVMVWQATWYREQAESLERYVRGLRQAEGASAEEVAAVVIERDWPIRIR